MFNACSTHVESTTIPPTWIIITQEYLATGDYPQSPNVTTNP